MPDNFELLIPVLGLLFGSIIILVPIAGLTLRFAVKPAVEAYARLRESQSTPELRALEQRVALLEQQLRMPAPTHLEAAPLPLVAEVSHHRP